MTAVRTGIALAMLLAAAPAVRADMVSMRAHYSLSLATAASDNPLQGVEGALDIEQIQTCDGWSFRYDQAQQMTTRDGRRWIDRSAISARESLDGRQLRFTVHVEPRKAISSTIAAARR
jgi:hypothetical protein